MSRPTRVLASDPDADAPEWWRRSARLSRVSIVAVVVIVAIVLVGTRGSAPPAITKSCTTPAFVLSTYSTKAHKTLQWSATGPAGQKFALTIGIASFTLGTGGLLHPVPDAGVGPHDVRATGVQTMGGGCLAHGAFGIALPKGSYTVRLFRVVGKPGHATAAAVAQRTLTITA